MKRLVLVHGMNNQNNSSRNILQEWIEAIAQGAGRDPLWAAKVRANATAPFYGIELYNRSTNTDPFAGGAAATANTTLETLFDAELDGTSDQIGTFESAMMAYAERLADEIDESVPQVVVDPFAGDASGILPEGIQHRRELKRIAMWIESKSPLKGQLVLKLLKQADVYLNKPGAFAAINAIVQPELAGPEPKVVVAHSLGTIVTYALIREANGQANISQYVTLGSPLSVDVIAARFQVPRSPLSGVAHWFNAADKDDFVALKTNLTAANFGPNILNDDTIENGKADQHAILDYLRHSSVASRIALALEG